MAAGKFSMNKASGGVASITVADGVGATNIVLPESGTVATISNIVGFKNYIINGNFNIWQRGTSFNIPAGGSAYTSDRWFIYNSTNQEVNISKAYMSPFSLEPIPRLRIAFTVAPTSGNVYVAQIMELMQELSNKTVTTQVLHGSLENLSFNGYFTQNFGSGGSTQVTTPQLSDTSSGDLTVKNYVRTVTLPSVKDKTIGSNYYTEYVISLPIRSINPFSIAQVQLEEGSVATPFENLSYALQYEQCRRYYRRYATQQNVNDLAYKMRTTPTESGTAPYTYSAEL